jgi:aminopeptidase-like protein
MTCGAAADNSAEAMSGLVRELYPLNRSITGEAVRDTLRRVARVVPLTIHEVPTGTKVLDWEIPREWNVRDAYVGNAAGDRVIDFRRSNLHLMGYSVPIRARMTLAELRPHLYSDPTRPGFIPYRTSYYAENWGFCLSHQQLLGLPDGEYEVVIDSRLEPGSLSYGEAVIPGSSSEEMIFYTHTCHPSLCNDNLSGIAVCAELGRWLAGRSNRLTYRIVFGPGTIGSIAWLARNRAVLPRIRHGLVVALVGNRAPLMYKQTRSGSADIDRIAAAYLANEAPDGTVVPFSAWGYDERQFGSPGFALPVGRLTRSPEEGYPEYHSSGDDLSIIDGAALAASLLACQTIVEVIEGNHRYRNAAPFGEPQLGRRGIYRSIGGSASADLQKALLWMLSLSDGQHDVARIYERSRLPFHELAKAIELLRAQGLLGLEPPSGARAT